MKRGDETKRRILDAGLLLARQGLSKVTQRGVGEACEMSHTNVRYYFDTVQSLHDAVVADAIERKDRHVMARLVMDDHPAMRSFSRKVRQDLLASSYRIVG
jgi:AcrR family transcriptional regulator